MKKIYFYILFSIITIITSAQNTDWIRGYEATETDIEYPRVLCDNENNIISMNSVFGKKQIFNKVVNAEEYPFWNLVITKTTKENELIFVYNTKTLPINAFAYDSHIDPINLKCDADNNLYLTASYTGDIDFGNGVKVSSEENEYRLILIKFTKDGVPLWVRELRTEINYYFNNMFENDNNLEVSEDHIYFNTFSFFDVYLPHSGDTIKNVNKSNILYCFDTSGKYKFNYRIDNTHLLANNIIVDKNNKNNIYLGIGTYTDIKAPLLILKSKDNNHLELELGTFNIIRLDTNGNVSLEDKITNVIAYSIKGYAAINFAIDFSTNPITTYIASNVFNELLINNDTIINNIPSPKIPFGIYKIKQHKLEWLKYTQSDLKDTNISFFINHLVYRNNNLFFEGEILDGDTYLDTFFIEGKNINKGTNCSNVLGKLDTDGNFQWIAVQPSCNNDHIKYTYMDCDDYGDMYVTGIYKNDVFELNDKKVVTSNNFLKKGITAKVTLRIITREEILDTVYCSGDNIDIPFSSIGNYHIDNYFTAELSDAFGNFEENIIELGRLKTQTSGLIKGQIPIQVPTSNKYRIRIKASKPIWFNEYEIDTLRLTIFSKDKANAGPDVSICDGDSIKLSTFGGTSWQWSPGEITQDSNFWTTWAYPKKTTDFKVTIKDSSGCGNGGTDYVRITVRVPLDIQAPFNDTIVNKGDSVIFYANTFGGFEIKHHVKWYQKLNNQLLILDSGKMSLKLACDTGKIIYAILWDSCSADRDTQIYYLNYLQKLKVTIVSKLSSDIDVNDTFVCIGNSIKLFAKGSGGIASGYNFNWYHQNKTLVGTGNSITISPDSSENYFVVFSNNNTLKADTNYVFIKVYKKLETEIFIKNKNIVELYKMPDDTTLCHGNSLTYIAKIKGGDSLRYKYEWYVDTKKFTANDTFNIKFPTNNNNDRHTENLMLVAKDQCSKKADTVTAAIHILAKTKINLLAKDTICFGTSEIFNVNAKGGDSLNYSYEWKVAGTLFSGNDAVVFPPNSIANKVGNHQLSVKVKDACTFPDDSIVKNIFIADTLNLKVNIPDTFCVGNIIEINATATGGLAQNYKYEWYWNGNLVSSNYNFSYQTTQNDEGKINNLNIKLRDNCSVKNIDYNKFVFVNTPLKTNIEIDSHCFDNKATLTAKSEGGKTSQYEYEWYVNDEPKEINKTGKLFFASDEITNIKVVLNDDGCSLINDSTEISLQALIPKISVELSPKVGCVPSEVRLKITNENNTRNTYTWHTGNGMDSISETGYFSNIYDKVGLYQSDIDVITNNNCTLKNPPELIRIFPLPSADFRWNPSIVSLNNPQVYFENKSFDGNYFQWFINDSLFSNDANPNYLFYDTGLYKITLITQTKNTCTDTLDKLLYMNDYANYYIPNAFTPNGDGLNDVFMPIVAGIKSYEIQIYNRWGALIFEGDMEHHWDGTFSNTPLTDGSYAYIIRLVRMDTSVIYTKGILHLMR